MQEGLCPQGQLTSGHHQRPILQILVKAIEKLPASAGILGSSKYVIRGMASGTPSTE